MKPSKLQSVDSSTKTMRQVLESFINSGTAVSIVTGSGADCVGEVCEVGDVIMKLALRKQGRSAGIRDPLAYIPICKIRACIVLE